MYVRAIVNAIVNNNGEVLLVRRRISRHDPWSGDIALPGGRIRAGENPVSAGLRETLEETGIEPEDLYVYGIVGLEYPRNTPWLKTAIMVSKPRRSLSISPGDEVEEVFWFNPRKTNCLKLLVKNDRLVLGYEFSGRVIWGMTWRILRKLIVRGFI